MDEREIKCLNFEFCQNTFPTWFSRRPYCIGCDVNGWKTLEIRDTTEECCVCYETRGRELKFPADCGHYFCIPCSREIINWNECRTHLDPVPYGCPSCPNGCANPSKGIQCYCEEYDEIQNSWRISHPWQFKKWNDDEHESIETTIDPVYGSRLCPLCRRHTKKAYWEK